MIFINKHRYHGNSIKLKVSILCMQDKWLKSCKWLGEPGKDIGQPISAWPIISKITLINDNHQQTWILWQSHQGEISDWNLASDKVKENLGLTNNLNPKITLIYNYYRQIDIMANASRYVHVRYTAVSSRNIRWEQFNGKTISTLFFCKQ